MFFNKARTKETTVNLLSAFGHFVPELVISTAWQLNVNEMWQRDLKLGTIRPSSQTEQTLDGIVVIY